MSTRGRRPRFTREQRERVVAIAAEGASQREIAKRVFGDVRYRGRVERILAAETCASSASVAARNEGSGSGAAGVFEGLSEREVLRELVGRAERALLESSDPPALVDIERLVRLKRQLDSIETVDRLNRIVLELNQPSAAG